MHHVHISSLPWEEQASPRKTFHSFCRNISLALGCARNAGLWGGGHPFDVQIRRIPPGASVCPFHSHLTQWELFVVLAGTGTVRAGAERHAIATGEVFVHPPGEPHQLTNTGPTDLEVLIVADNPQLDGCHYPDSDKWALRPGKIFRLTEAGYFDGEEEPIADAPPRPPVPFPTGPALTPFAQRKIHPDALAWDDWSSPKKKYRASFKGLSESLGAKRNTPIGLGGHPFDLELGQVPPGFSGCPLHSHTAQWEFYIFLSGTATVRTLAGTTVVRAGDVVLHPPGEAHQFTNTGDDEVRYWLIADNPPYDLCHYPDSNKWGPVGPSRQFFRILPADYWDGEE